ncbi:MAG: hypothetical protein AMJ65_03100 [Phycisphaerae bacterium SG8_4]|nr:MAG: hypothetical protein AMJ65_03100 [Phycisphaerae bacterium SG8_4]
MIFLGSVFIPTSRWLWPAAAVLAATLLLLIWSYRRAPAKSTAHWIAFCLKLLGILMLVLCLIEPLWSGRRAKSGANLFVVIADNSGGMNVRDQGAEKSRGEMLRAALNIERADWLGTLANNFQVRQYVFDSRLRRATDFSELNFDGNASAIGMALRTVAQRYRDKPLAGVLLMTDGNATDMAEQFYDLAGVPAVYPVVIGSAKPQKDIALTNLSVTQTSFEDAPVLVQANVEASGYAGKTVEINLVEHSGTMVERQEWQISKDDQKQTFRFRVRPDRSGILFYRLKVAEVSKDESQAESVTTPEATLANNQRTVVVDRGRGPYRILYVSGRPNWEYKFLRRAVSEDEQVQLIGLLRVARREPKFDWRGRRGDRSNPLYRGFDNKDEDQTEQYDQPVLIPMYPVGWEDVAELRDGFPKTEEKLFRYHAVILDDVEAEFFSHDQMELLYRFVAERGGGFLMLGGKESFREGGFHRTPIGRILPVYLDRMGQAETTDQIRLNLTREGWLQPWARLRDNEQDEQQRLSEMPAFEVLNRVRTIKAGARVVATAGSEQTQRFPALVAQRFGNGRTAAITIGDMWRWGLKQAEMHDDMDKFWRQTVRWLVADVPGRTSLRIARERDKANQPVALRVDVRDKDFEPMDNVSVSIELRDPNDQTVRLRAEAVPGESGLFEAAYVPRFSGGYFARAVVTDEKDNEIGDAETGWAADLEAREFRSIRANRPLLETIAGRTGGRVVELDELNDFARELPSRDVPITTTQIKPLWDLAGIGPTVFLLALMCFAGEWALRRWKGMP